MYLYTFALPFPKFTSVHVRSIQFTQLSVNCHQGPRRGIHHRRGPVCPLPASARRQQLGEPPPVMSQKLLVHYARLGLLPRAPAQVLPEERTPESLVIVTIVTVTKARALPRARLLRGPREQRDEGAILRPNDGLVDDGVARPAGPQAAFAEGGGKVQPEVQQKERAWIVRLMELVYTYIVRD